MMRQLSSRLTHLSKALLASSILFMMATASQAEIDGHGPDSWRVTGVSANDFLNARMGPGTAYPVIEKFSHNERNMQQITCVPYYTLAHYSAMTEAQLAALPPRWCLMRNKSLTKAGWVAQRYITPDNAVSAEEMQLENMAHTSKNTVLEPSGDPIVAQAEEMVRELYERYDLLQLGAGPDPLKLPMAADFFTDDIVAFLTSDKVQAHPIYGAQDFDVVIEEPRADPDHPMLRGMITINVDYTNFGKPQRAVYFLRADTTKSNAPLRIFRVEHDGWSYP